MMPVSTVTWSYFLLFRHFQPPRIDYSVILGKIRAGAVQQEPRVTMPAEALPGRFDVAIIGAGVVGCAIARRLALAGARVAVIEKALDILDGASKGNSAILHTGFDAPTGSL